MSRPVPEALARRGIVGLTDNLPAGARLDVAADFVRIFRPELEARLFGLGQPPERRPAGADFSDAQP